MTIPRALSRTRRPWRSLGQAALLLLLWPAWLPAAGTATEAGPRLRRVAVDDASIARVIVKYRAGSALMHAAAATPAPRPQHAAALGARLGLALQDGRVLGARTQALRGQGLASAELARQLAAQADVEWAEVDQRRTITAAVPNDPYYGPNQATVTPRVGQWYLRAPDSTAVAAINAVGAWGTTTGSSTVTVAVLDTGVRFEHPDLAGKLYPGYDFIADTATAGDGGGRDSDATDPGDFTTAGASCGASDSSWHGTQVSGLIAAASDNGVGMAGTGRDVMILPVRVLGKCGGYDSDIQAAMLWAGGLSSSPVANVHPAKVINMSLGSTGACTQGYIDAFAALNAAGVTVTVAAGNENGTAVGTPANCPGALAVGGLRHVGSKVGYSNVGPEVAISAPAGNCVNTSGACLYPLLTTLNLGATTATSSGYSDSSNYSVGTSFSAPLVAGTAALMLSVDPTLTPAAIRSKLQSTARAFVTSGGSAGTPQCHAPTASEQIECYCTTTTCGAGMLDAAAAVAAATPSAGAPPTGVITLSATSATNGDTVTLGSTGSSAISGRSIVGYAWQLVSGSDHAAFIGAADGSTASLLAGTAGSVLVQLTVTDSSGASNSKIRSLTVTGTTNTPPVTTPGASGEPSGGGGGAFSALWLGLLALGALALAREDWRQRRQQRVRASDSARTAR